ncbi:MAG: 50S ribosomal protein L9 [Flavobacteriaceae bacterium]
MELILKEDVQNLGFKDDVVKVKNGYGRNYLIPNGLAILATSSAKKVLAENMRQKAHKETQIIDGAKKIEEAIKTLEIKIPAKVGAQDRLFGSVSNMDLAAALGNAGHEIDKKYITIKGGTIKRTGPYEAQIRLHREVIVELPFEVVPEKK